MKFVLFFLVLSTQAIAASGYDLKIKVQRGDHIMTPRMMIKENETATFIRDINGKEEFIDVEASDRVLDGKRGILLKMAIGEIGQNGERIILSRPHMIVEEHTPGTLTIESATDEKITTTITADRIEI